MKYLFALVTIFITLSSSTIEKKLYRISSATVKFTSEAPLELIEASSNKVKGIISSEDQTFAFTIPIRSFEGFNSPLQMEHFNENYMESDLYPDATFTGSIIEDINFDEPGEYNIRAKGKLNIHGVKQNKIIYVDLIILEDEIQARSSFEVLLDDHNISVPKIVNKKIAEIIDVNVDLKFDKNE